MHTKKGAYFNVHEFMIKHLDIHNNLYIRTYYLGTTYLYITSTYLVRMTSKISRSAIYVYLPNKIYRRTLINFYKK